jgi:hypothetical protein
MLKDFHPAQLTYVLESRRTAKYGNIATFALGISACVVCILPSHWSLKLSNIAIASGLFITSYKLEKLQKWGEDYNQVNNHESIKGFARHLDSSFAPPRKEVAIAEVVAPPKLADIREALSKPHCMLLGSTGNGKSTLAKYLAANCNAFTIAIDPHAAPNDWGDIPIFGAGRRYGEIAQIMEVTLNLMQKRYDARDRGVTQFEPIVIITDEFPAIIASKEAGELASNWMKLISREARKVAIRLVVLTQSPEVQAIGLKGEGSVRDNFCFIRLGEFALDHAKSLKDEAAKQFIEAASRPAMIGNAPCSIPDLSNKVTMPKVPAPRDYQMLIADIADSVDAPELEPIDRPTNQQSAALMQSSSQSAPSAPNQQSATLSAPLQQIVDYAKKKDEWISARQIQAGIAIFKSAKASEIREYFKYLATLGYGITRGTDENLEFSAA